MIGWIFIVVCTLSLIGISLCVVYDKRPRFLRHVTAITILCIWAAALWTLIRRFSEGLGAVAGVNDLAPWGLWIGADVFAGVALAAGGFVIAATVHIFRIERFKPILRPTVLTAFLGYVLVAVALFIDIGRPLSWWHPLVMWQGHSIMFEVTWCVVLYSTVLAIEISPVVLERLGLTRLLRLVKATTIPVVIAGVILSTMHQSSLGSLYLIVPGKLYPLWYSPLLPVFFLISAVAAGMCVVIVESFFSAKILKRGLESSLMAALGKAASFILFLYLLIKFSDLAASGAWDLLYERNLQSNMFLLEMLGGVALPAILLSFQRIRNREKFLLSASLLVMAGIVLNRINVSWIGMSVHDQLNYYPTWMEIALSLGFITAGTIIFFLAVHYLPVFPKTEEEPPEAISAGSKTGLMPA
ncbi:MAG: Ni/Fe-hydrogenase cytochrome b subunit [Xanthomonadales bacterium]|nr:Ni/Fe-hydrogenase cytochrome b subunit [Xanthomonadales bacterium]MDH4020753.1 Ni/Fe-hydrogenase cytochrome b subunit [Xanthomonadales bacterium]